MNTVTHTHPLRTIADLGPRDHLCCLYETEEEHRAVLTPFLRQGLERGEKVIYIVDAHTAETILGYLRDDGVDVEPYLTRGQLVILTRDDAYMQEGVFDPEAMIAWLRSETERALVEGYPSLRVTGEMTWALRRLPGSERLIEHEARLNEFFPGRRCLVICQYDRRRFASEVLLDVLCTHPVAVVGTVVYENFYYIPPTELRGRDPSAAKLRHRLENLVGRQRAEEALQESEASYRSLFERLPLGLYRTTPTGQIVDANPALVQMLGYPDRESLLGVNAPDVHVDAEDRRREQALLEREGIVRDFEMPLRQRNGRVIWVRDNTRAVRDAGGRVLYYEGSLEDITEHQRAEEALQESHRQLESRERFIFRTLESIPSSLVVIDRSLRIVSVNRNFLEKARREAQTTLGRKIEEVFPQVLLEYTRLDQRVREIFRTGNSVEGGKVAYRAPGLATRIYYYRLIPLKAEEVVENVMLLMDDITDREQLREEVQRVERHLVSVVECASDLVISMDPQGYIITWNRAAERTSGLKAEQVKGQSLSSLCVADQRAAMAEMLQRLARAKGVQNAEVNLLTAGNQEVPIAWSCSPMRDEAGQVAGIVAVGRDLTERRRLEAQLIQSAKMAFLGVMAGGIAHELRNPLGIISLSAELLLERPDDAQLRTECVEKIHAATQRASLIIENLLKFARPQSAQMKGVDLHAVLEETLAMLAHQMTLGKVTLRKEFQANLPRVHGNPELLQQVFTNLILNACNAMPQGGTLTVATQATEVEEASPREPTLSPAKGSARGVGVRFSDTGCGIPPENLPKMFVPFFTTMPVGKGTGLGLAISYSIVQQHHGTIEVESQVGRGTTFTVRLPAQWPMADSRWQGARSRWTINHQLSTINHQPLAISHEFWS